jgi:hypothetical protein
MEWRTPMSLLVMVIALVETNAKMGFFLPPLIRGSLRVDHGAQLICPSQHDNLEIPLKILCLIHEMTGQQIWGW